MNRGNRTRGEKRHTTKHRDELVARARRMYRPGIVSYAAIAETLGVSRWTVRDWVQRWTRV